MGYKPVEYAALVAALMVFFELVAIFGAIVYYVFSVFLLPIGRNFILPAGGTSWQVVLVGVLYGLLPIVTLLMFLSILVTFYVGRGNKDTVDTLLGSFYAINVIMAFFVLIALAIIYFFGYIVGAILFVAGYYSLVYASALDIIAILVFLVGLSWLASLAVQKILGFSPEGKAPSSKDSEFELRNSFKS